MNDKPKMEPAADLRQSANMMRQVYIALVDEGFSEQQALVILGQMLSAAILKGDT